MLANCGLKKICFSKYLTNPIDKTAHGNNISFFSYSVLILGYYQVLWMTFNNVKYKAFVFYLIILVVVADVVVVCICYLTVVSRKVRFSKYLTNLIYR